MRACVCILLQSLSIMYPICSSINNTFEGFIGDVYTHDLTVSIVHLLSYFLLCACIVFLL